MPTGICNELFHYQRIPCLVLQWYPSNDNFSFFTCFCSENGLYSHTTLAQHFINVLALGQRHFNFVSKILRCIPAWGALRNLQAYIYMAWREKGRSVVCKQWRLGSTCTLDFPYCTFNKISNWEKRKLWFVTVLQYKHGLNSLFMWHRTPETFSWLVRADLWVSGPAFDSRRRRTTEPVFKAIKSQVI